MSVIWNYKAPKGTGDTHQSIMRGSKCDLIIKQGDAENFKPTLYVVSKGKMITLNRILNNALQSLQSDYPGIEADKISDSKWKIVIPKALKIGHEAHFGQVTNNFLKVL